MSGHKEHSELPLIFVHAIPEIVPSVIYALAGGAIPLRLTALQILAIDLGTDTVPALALGREPAEPGTMVRAPRPREAGIISHAMLARAWLRLGVLEALLVTGGYFLVLLAAGSSPGDPTGAGAPLSRIPAVDHDDLGRDLASQIGVAFALRTGHSLRPQGDVLRNRHLLRGIAFTFALAGHHLCTPAAIDLKHRGPTARDTCSSASC